MGWAMERLTVPGGKGNCLPEVRSGVKGSGRVAILEMKW
jgi:hypothetical protein